MNCRLVVPLESISAPGDDLGELSTDSGPHHIRDPNNDHQANLLSTLRQGPKESLQEPDALVQHWQVVNDPREGFAPSIGRLKLPAFNNDLLVKCKVDVLSWLQ